MIVACVCATKPGSLDSGPTDPKDYGPAQVASLRRQFREHLPVKHKFVCLTDDGATMMPHCDLAIPLMWGWGGWWSKIEVFAWTWPGPVLYCDLDNVLLGDVSALVGRGFGFVGAKDWDYPIFNSSLMWLDGDYRWIFETFRKDPETYSRIHDKIPMLGDQSFISSCLSTRDVTPRYWQDELPGYFRSRHDMNEGRLDGGRMLLWHGQPKPWQLAPGKPGSGIERVRRTTSGED